MPGILFLIIFSLINIILLHYAKQTKNLSTSYITTFCTNIRINSNMIICNFDIEKSRKRLKNSKSKF